MDFGLVRETISNASETQNVSEHTFQTKLTIYSRSIRGTFSITTAFHGPLVFEPSQTYISWTNFTFFKSAFEYKTHIYSKYMAYVHKGKNSQQQAVLFCSLAVLDPRVGHGTMDVHVYFLHLSLSSVILIDSSTDSPEHVLMLSIQAVRGLPRLHAPDIVPCIISFSRQLPCFLMLWP